jgi:hypothetical protein
MGMSEKVGTISTDGGQKEGTVAIEQTMVIGGNAKLKLPQISFRQVPP